jgi:endonuclease VIII-like 1
MPEGPELRMNAKFINNVCEGMVFCGQPIRSPVSKSPEIDWESPLYTISSESRGKELALFLHCKKVDTRKTRILFRFGMSGKFTFTGADRVPKHAHLQFRTVPGKTEDEKAQVLSFIDTRRFGSWRITDDWGEKRGPDIIDEFDQFRANVLGSLEDVAFNRPICETMLNQKYFNGIGNYLRAEILYRYEEG